MKTQVWGEEAKAFPVYATRAEYAAAHNGVEPPPFNDELPPKNWYDPAAATSSRPVMVYPNVLMEQDDGRLVEEDGELVFAPISLPRAQAGSVNMLPESSGQPVGQSGLREIPCPYRALLPGEKMILATMPNMPGSIYPVIRNVAAYAAEQAALAEAQINDDGKFTPADRAMLKAIAGALGVGG
jgi:hypothetical protein